MGDIVAEASPSSGPAGGQLPADWQQASDARTGPRDASGFQSYLDFKPNAEARLQRAVPEV